jgi:histone H3/H4
MAKLSLAAMERLLKKAGAPRVGEDAKEALAELLEEHALDIGKRATQLARHANRRTVMGSDVRLARK